MKHFVSLGVSLLIIVCALIACDTPNEVITPPPTLDPNIAADARAIEAQQQANASYQTALADKHTADQAAASATALYNAQQAALARTATRQFLDASQKQTDVALQMQIASATEQARRLSDQQTATAEASLTFAAQTQAALSVTALYNASMATAHASETHAAETPTARAIQATETAVAVDLQTKQDQAEWDRRLNAARTLVWFAVQFIVGALALIGLLVLIGWAVLRLLDALVLRLRVIRDKTGVPYVIMEPDREGRQTMFAPSRSPGPALTLTPSDIQPVQIAAHAIDADTTKRDQAVSLMLAATGGSKHSAAGELAEALGEEQIRMIEAPPAQLLPPEAQSAIDADWKVINDA